MPGHAFLRRPLLSITRAIGHGRLPRHERALLIGGISFAGVSGWELRRFAAAAAAGASAIAVDSETTVVTDLRRAQEAARYSGVPQLEAAGDPLESPTGNGGALQEAVNDVLGEPTETRAVRHDEHTSTTAPSIAIRRLPSRSGRLPKQVQEPAEAQTEAHRDVFESVVQAASTRPKDGKTRSPQMVSAEQLQSSYFRAMHGRAKHAQHKQVKRRELQQARHPTRMVDENTWLRDVLTLLERASPTDPEAHLKKLETVQLPKDVRAVFKAHESHAILELMQRTGSHAQYFPSTGDRTLKLPDDSEEGTALYRRAFQRLTLWGTPDENTEALRLLPQMVHAVTAKDLEASKTLADYDIDLEEKRVKDRTNNTTGVDEETDASYWHEQDSTLDHGSEAPMGVEHADKARSTIVALHETSPIRATWSRGNPWSWEHVKNSFSCPRDRKQAAGGLSADQRSGSDLLTTADSAALPAIAQRRPVLDNAVAVTAYVHDVTCLPARQLRRRMRHNDHIADGSNSDSAYVMARGELLNVMSNRELSVHLTSEAIDTILQFLVRHSDLGSFREVTKLLEENGQLALTASSSDILLADAAKHEDLYCFGALLRLMIRRGLTPTWRTWVNLQRLVCLRVPTHIDTVEKRMQRAGVFLSVQAVREAISHRIEHDLKRHLSQADATFEQFIAMYDERYGQHRQNRPRSGTSANNGTREKARHWLDPSTANRMVKVLLAHGRMQDALSVVTTLEQSGEPVKTDTLNTFLTSALRAQKPEAAVAILQHFRPWLESKTNPISLNRISYDILFKVAWQKSHFNMSRVIWRYACATGNTSWAMQEKIRKSLISYIPAPGSFCSRAVNQVEGDVGGSASKAAQRKVGLVKKVVRDQKIPSRVDVFFGWAGKFVVGMSGGLTSPQPSNDRCAAVNDPARFPGTEDEGYASSDEVQLDTDGTHAEISQPQPELTQHECTLAAISHQLRSTNQEVHKARSKHLHNALEADLSEALSLRPTVPFHVVLEQAWQKDLQWKDSGLGLVYPGKLHEMYGEDWSEEEIATWYRESFEEMLMRGIQVPMEVGSAVR